MYGTSATVTYLHEDGSVERYEISVECWVEEDAAIIPYVPPAPRRIRSGETHGGVQFIFEESAT